jgi:hypothetical protein
MKSLYWEVNVVGTSESGRYGTIDRIEVYTIK